MFWRTGEKTAAHAHDQQMLLWVGVDANIVIVLWSLDLKILLQTSMTPQIKQFLGKMFCPLSKWLELLQPIRNHPEHLASTLQHPKHHSSSLATIHDIVHNGLNMRRGWQSYVWPPILAVHRPSASISLLPGPLMMCPPSAMELPGQSFEGLCRQIWTNQAVNWLSM